jgi:hypothetical protein
VEAGPRAAAQAILVHQVAAAEQVSYDSITEQGGGAGQGKGQGGAGGWPLTTGNPSGGGRSNNPPRQKYLDLNLM